jgi:hypothetical protein
VKAGTYHFVLDAIVTQPVDCTFALIARKAGNDTVLATWGGHFDPVPGSFDAQPFEYDEPAAAIDSGSQLVFRYTGTGATAAEAWIPNGDGKNAHGRIPNITLP